VNAEEPNPNRSPSQTLIDCMGKFAEAEPTRVMVVWTDESGDLCWSLSGERSYTQMIGMVECVKAVLMRQFLEMDD